MRSSTLMTGNLAVMLMSFLLVSCSPPPPPAALNEAELLQGLAKVVHHGPVQFKRQTWPLLADKTITYCGTVAEVQGTDTHSSVTLHVDKTHEGTALPWSLEGKSNSPDLAREYQAGDDICLTGSFEGYVVVQYYEPPYRGTVKLASWEKPATSRLTARR